MNNENLVYSHTAVIQATSPDMVRKQLCAMQNGGEETIRGQLRRELPGLRGFSPTSIKKMRTFYEQWHTVN